MSAAPDPRLEGIRDAIEAFTEKQVKVIERIHVDLDRYDDLNDYEGKPYPLVSGNSVITGEVFLVYQYEHNSKVWLFRRGVVGLPDEWSCCRIFKEGSAFTSAEKRAIIMTQWDLRMSSFRHCVVAVLEA